MKQAKRKKSAAAPAPGAEAALVVDQPSLPDADYVEHLLAASAPPVDGAVEMAAPADADMEQRSLCLPDQCLLRDAVEYRQDLVSCLPVRKVMVDAGAVERIDAAFMQVLLAFVRSRSGDVEPVQWVKVSSIFAEAAQLLGLREALALPAAA